MSFALPQRKWKTKLGTIFYLSIKKSGWGDWWNCMEILYLSWMLHTGRPSTVFLFLWLSWEPMWNMSFQPQSLWLRGWDVRKYQRGFSHSKILEPRSVSSHWTHHAGLQWGRNQRCQGRVWICQSPPLCLLQRTSLGEMGEKWYWLLIFTVNQFSFKEFFNKLY